MSQRDVKIILNQILTHAEEAVALTSDKSRPDLDKNRLLNLAVVRLLEIIGEAASRMPKESQASYPQIAWPEIISMRNRLIHGYDQVDFDIVWAILNNDLPNLISQLKEILMTSK